MQFFNSHPGHAVGGGCFWPACCAVAEREHDFPLLQDHLPVIVDLDGKLVICDLRHEFIVGISRSRPDALLNRPSL